ncbi:MAG: DsbA family protein [Hyphomicrobiaceae bacterium]|nr:DsbA family protein [Hyphomicrobiaceae bacterium]
MTYLSERLIAVRLARRSALIGATLLALAPGLALAQDAKAPAGDITAELMKPVPRGDLTLGKADAPVTIVEYASMTCSHCANFHTKVLPKLKEKYVDTGKVRLILREFPLDNLAAAGAMLARCAGPDKSFGVIATLFEKQNDWAFVEGNPVPALFKLVGQHGFTKESFDKCLTDQKLLDDITSVRDKAGKQFGVRSTPTFFINGKQLKERSDDIASFDRAIEPLLK